MTVVRLFITNLSQEISSFVLDSCYFVLFDSIAVKFPQLMTKKPKEGQDARWVAQLDWKIVEGNCEKPSVASGLQFIPLPVSLFAEYFYNPKFIIKKNRILNAGDAWGRLHLPRIFFFGEKCRVAHLSDVSHFPGSRDYGKCPGISISPINLVY